MYSSASLLYPGYTYPDSQKPSSPTNCGMDIEPDVSHGQLEDVVVIFSHAPLAIVQMCC